MSSATIESLSPIYQDLFARRFRSRNSYARNATVGTRKCSGCHGYGHTIKKCCANVTINVLIGVCSYTDSYLKSYNQGEITQQVLESQLHDALFRSPMITVKVLAIFASFINCNITRSSPTSERKKYRIIWTLEEMFRPVNPTSPPTVQPPPLQVTQVIPSQIIPPQVIPPAIPPAIPRVIPYYTPTPSFLTPVLPLQNIHIQLDLEEKPEAHDCPICYETTHSMTTLQCSHRVCIDCFVSIVKTNYAAHANRAVNRCPICRCGVNHVSVCSHENFYKIAIVYLYWLPVLII